jgi:hypothetical protein
LPIPAGPYRTNRQQHHHATPPELVEVSTIGTSIAILHRPRRQPTLKTATFQQELTCFFAPRINHYHSSCEGCPSHPSVRPINRVWDPPRTVSPQRPPIIELYSLVMGVTSSPWCDQCRLLAMAGPPVDATLRYRPEGSPISMPHRPCNPGKYVSIPRRPLAAG